MLVVQPVLDPPGGGSAVAAWMLEALKAEHRIALLTWQRPDLAEVNRFYGTTLTPAEFEVHVVPIAVRRVFARLPGRYLLVRDTYLMRRARRLAPAFDVVISAEDEADLGPRGIQYIHYPRFATFRPDVDLRQYYTWPALARAYRICTMRATGTSLTRMRRNLTLANSDFIAARVRAVHGVGAVTVYPPTAGPFPNAAWEDREDGFVCVGRIAPIKRIERIIDVVQTLRTRGHAVHLHIVGTEVSSSYAAGIRRRVRACADWITLDENLSRQALCELLSRHRYGIHGMDEEHFGMAISEMATAGCIVFVPDGGGQREIVGGDERLVYRSTDSAADKIARVLGDHQLQRALRAHLAGRCAAFSSACFVHRIRQIVAEFRG